MKRLNKYETIFVIKPQEEEQLKALVEQFKNLIETQAQLDSVDEWGMKKLAYEVNKQKEGYYVLINFSANPDFPQELERNYKITESILKYIIIRKED